MGGWGLGQNGICMALISCYVGLKWIIIHSSFSYHLNYNVLSSQASAAFAHSCRTLGTLDAADILDTADDTLGTLEATQGI